LYFYQNFNHVLQNPNLMKKIFLLVLVVLAIASCSKKSDSTTTTGFSNKLELGTGLNPSNLFQLTGVGTTFKLGGTIYFRLESADDMGSSAVRIQIDKQDGTAVATYDYPSIQSYGHIFLSTFSVEVPGNYKATGILLTGNKTIASASFVVAM
jgi:hypothetical protein